MIKYEDGTEEPLNPRDYVLYHAHALKPVGKITEAEFLSSYTQPIDLCSSCQQKVDSSATIGQTQPQEAPSAPGNATPPPAPPSAPQGQNQASGTPNPADLFASGKTITVQDKNGNPVVLKNMDDLKAWGSGMGVSV